MGREALQGQWQRIGLLAAVGALVAMVAALVFFLRMDRSEDDGPLGTLDQPEPQSQSGSNAVARSIATTDIEDTPPARRRRGPCVAHGVVSWEDGELVEGAEIHVFVPDPAFKSVWGFKPRSWVPTGIATDDSGEYRLPRQETCPLRLGASFDGHGWAEEWDRPVTKRDTPPYEMRRDLTMRAAKEIVGRVVNPDDEPVEGATVSASIAWTQDRDMIYRTTREERTPRFWETALRGWAHQTATDEDGAFRFEALELEDWKLLAEADGYSQGMIEIAREELGVESVVIAMNDPECWVVRVVDEHDVPVEGARLTISPSIAATDRRQERVSDPSGRVEICEVDPHGAGILGVADGMTREWVTNVTGQQEYELMLYHAATLVGTVQPPPLTDRSCMFAHPDGRSVGPMMFWPDENGRFEVDHVSTVKASASISCEGGHHRFQIEAEAGEEYDIGLVVLKPFSGKGPRPDLWAPGAM